MRLYRLKNDTILELDRDDARSRLRALEPEEGGLTGYALSSYFAARNVAAHGAGEVRRVIEQDAWDAETAAIEAYRGPSVTQCESCGGTGEIYEPGTECCRACGGTGWLSMA